MEAQNQIKRRLSTPSGLAEVHKHLSSSSLNRTELARRLCDSFSLYDARGQTQTAGCLKALAELSAAGHFDLPAARSRPRRGTPRRLSSPVPLPEQVPASAGSVRDLTLVLVNSDAQRRLWNELMLCEHPRGAGPLVGAQLRYLIGSAHGWLGGFGFSAAALNLRDRDDWIGWDGETRRAQLHRVLGMSRFLLRPQGCRNLASKVLGAVLKRLPGDFQQVFGYRPYLVESFVDSSFDGACYRAANFLRVGHSSGRGRQDRHHQYGSDSKAIYVYPLVDNLRQRLGVVSAANWTPLAVGDGLDSEHWAQQEFGDAPLGDARLSQRLVASAARLAELPGRAFTAVSHSDTAAIKGYYRLIDKPDLDAVTMDNILAPHQVRTRQRMANEARVLCIADGTTLDYSSLSECDGLGSTGSNQTGAISRGIQMHSTLAVNSDGVPLGIVDVRCRLPQGDAPPAKTVPLEEKKSYDWVASLRSCMALAEQLPDTRLTCVMDREADFFELFDAHRDNPCVDVLVRASHNRQTGDGKLFDRLRDSPLQGSLQLNVKRQSARAKRSKQKARAARVQRTAQLQVRYQQIEFVAPVHLRQAGHAPLSLWVVHAWEETPPAKGSALEWCLLTSREITQLSDAEQCLADYALRWRIEDWHRVLKSGCRVEELAHQRVERLQRAIAINLVIAWRIMVMTLLGREVPDLPAELLFSEVEIRVLQAWAKTAPRAKPPTNLGAAILLVACIGGYTNRNNDPPPGHELMWYGYQNLNLMCMGYELRD